MPVLDRRFRLTWWWTGALSVAYADLAVADVQDAWVRQAPGRAPARLVVIPQP